VNIKSPYIPTSFEGENTGEVNKAGLDKPRVSRKKETCYNPIIGSKVSTSNASWIKLVWV
jgi:hypothetical protein